METLNHLYGIIALVTTPLFCFGVGMPFALLVQKPERQIWTLGAFACTMLFYFAGIRLNIPQEFQRDFQFTLGMFTLVPCMFGITLSFLIFGVKRPLWVIVTEGLLLLGIGVILVIAIITFTHDFTWEGLSSGGIHMLLMTLAICAGMVYYLKCDQYIKETLAAMATKK